MWELSERDREIVAGYLGRPLMSDAEVVVRRRDTATPVVIRNAPFTADGTPMPTLYWLVDPVWRTAVSRLESAGGVKHADAAIDPEAVARAHASYAAERDAFVPVDWTGPRPSAGVGGTRQGVKCLHAHVAHVLAGGDDAVGRWVLAQLAAGVGSCGEVPEVVFADAVPAVHASAVSDAVPAAGSSAVTAVHADAVPDAVTDVGSGTGSAVYADAVPDAGSGSGTGAGAWA